MKLKDFEKIMNQNNKDLVKDVLDQIALDVFYLRLSNNLSQKELADLIGTKQSVISRLESRGSDPSMTLLLKISKALKVELQSPFKSSVESSLSKETSRFFINDKMQKKLILKIQKQLESKLS